MKNSKYRPDKENSINIMIEEMYKGARRRDVLKHFQKKWSVPESTFSTHWKIARDRYDQERSKINKDAHKKSAELEAKRNIMKRIDILDELSKIGRGEFRKISGEYIVPSDAERIRAMEAICKMQGYNSADEVKNVHEFQFKLNMPTRE